MSGSLKEKDSASASKEIQRISDELRKRATELAMEVVRSGGGQQSETDFPEDGLVPWPVSDEPVEEEEEEDQSTDAQPGGSS